MRQGQTRTDDLRRADEDRHRLRTHGRIEVRRGLAEVRDLLRLLPVDAVWAHGKDAGMRARARYADGVRAGLALAGDHARMTAWDLGYAAGAEDAADERRTAAARQARPPAGSSPSWLLA